MRSCLTLVVLCGSVASAAIAGETTLNWSSGDSLKGELVGSDGKSLTWKSRLFADPLQIELTSLASIAFPKTEPSQASDQEFCVLTRSGDVLSGMLKGINVDTVTFESKRFGTIRISRDQIASLQRLAGHGVIFLGPRGLNGWELVPRSVPVNAAVRLRNPGIANANAVGDKKVSNWIENLDGSLTTARPGADIFLSQPLPDKFEIELMASSSKPYSFSMVFGRNGKSGLRVETWVDVLVAVNGTRFAKLKDIRKDERAVHLHVFVNCTAKLATVYGNSGEKLGQIDTEGIGRNDGLMFRCLNNDLTIERLRINQWDGSPPSIAAGKESRVHLSDGRIHQGIVESLSETSGTFRMRVNNAIVEVPVTSISAVYLNTELIAQKQQDSAYIAWNDGGFVSGTLMQIDDRGAAIATPYSTEPVHCNLKDATRLQFASKTIVAEEADRLIHTDGALRGSLVIDGDSDTPIRWKPLGGLNHSALTYSGAASIVRSASVKHFSAEPKMLAGSPDVIYLANNDILPCRFEGFTDDTLKIKSPFTAVRSLAKQQVRAVELGVDRRIRQSGFGADGWNGLSAAEQQQPKLKLKSDHVYSHPSILTGDTIRFRLSSPPSAYTNLTLWLYGSAGSKDVESTTFTLSVMNSILQVLDRPPPAQNQVMFRGFDQSITKDIARVNSSAIDIQIVAKEGILHVSVDGVVLKTIKVNSAGAGSRAFAFAGSSVSPNRRVVVNGRVQSQSVGGAEISQFEVDNLAGVSVRDFIDEESRQAALTIPRFRRDNPPTHVLLAPNGDLLRGRLLGINDQEILFESRLETLRLPRDRVAAMVWLPTDKKTLDKDAAEKPDASKKLTDAGGASEKGAGEKGAGEKGVAVQLADGFRITVTPTRLVSGQLHGDSALLGDCFFPAAAIRELNLGSSPSNERFTAYAWAMKHAKEPDWDIPQTDGGSSAAAAMIGNTADDFQLPLLDGTTFRLKDHADKIVVLDFWATWCGPCVAALPDYIRATADFDSSRVIFIAVNLQETPDQIRGFLSERNLAPRVALDRAGEIARKFNVTGIPHTVILGPGNLVEDVHIGYQAGTGEVLNITIKQLLDGTWKRPKPGAERPQ